MSYQRRLSKQIFGGRKIPVGGPSHRHEASFLEASIFKQELKEEPEQEQGQGGGEEQGQGAGGNHGQGENQGVSSVFNSEPDVKLWVETTGSSGKVYYHSPALKMAIWNRPEGQNIRIIPYSEWVETRSSGAGNPRPVVKETITLSDSEEEDGGQKNAEGLSPLLTSSSSKGQQVNEERLDGMGGLGPESQSQDTSEGLSAEIAAALATLSLATEPLKNIKSEFPRSEGPPPGELTVPLGSLFGDSPPKKNIQKKRAPLGGIWRNLGPARRRPRQNPFAQGEAPPADLNLGHIGPPSEMQVMPGNGGLPVEDQPRVVLLRRRGPHDQRCPLAIRGRGRPGQMQGQRHCHTGQVQGQRHCHPGQVQGQRHCHPGQVQGQRHCQPGQLQGQRHCHPGPICGPSQGMRAPGAGSRASSQGQSRPMVTGSCSLRPAAVIGNDSRRGQLLGPPSQNSPQQECGAGVDGALGLGPPQIPLGQGQVPPGDLNQGCVGPSLQIPLIGGNGGLPPQGIRFRVRPPLGAHGQMCCQPGPLVMRGGRGPPGQGQMQRVRHPGPMGAQPRLKPQLTQEPRRPPPEQQQIQPQGPGGEGQGQSQGERMGGVKLCLTTSDENLVAEKTGERKTFFHHEVTKETVTWRRPQGPDIRIVQAGWVASETDRRKVGQSQGQDEVIEGKTTTGEEGSVEEGSGSSQGTSPPETGHGTEGGMPGPPPRIPGVAGKGGPRPQGQPRVMQVQPRGPQGQPGQGVLQLRGPPGQMQRLRHRGPIDKCRMCSGPQMLGMPRHARPPPQQQPGSIAMLQGHGPPGQSQGQGHSDSAPMEMDDPEVVDLDSEVETEGSASEVNATSPK